MTIRYKRNFMNPIKMNKHQLLDIVKENKIKHATEYEESVADYKALVLQIAKFNMQLAKTGNVEEFKRMRTMPTAPQTYEMSYVKAIKMLELSVDETIIVDEDIFNQLVLDEWDWKRGFLAAATMYKTQA